jgi:sulfonate transport system ATP-binding protein
VSKSYGDTRVLADLSLELEEGSFTSILGRSGSGKSTLLRIIAGLDDGYTGGIDVTGSVSVAFQEPRLWPWARVADNVAVGLGGRDSRERARAALAEVGLGDKATAWPLTLSGGQAQRASLARALVREPHVLLLDEPFGALDALTRLSMHELVLELWRKHRPTVLLVTHDVDEAITLADRVVVLDGGRISLDTSVRAPRGSRRGDPRAFQQRTELLAALGAVDPARIAVGATP